jgi:hypothetical protein
VIPKDFIRLASGYSINPYMISHIDFQTEGVVIYVGASVLEAHGADAAMLRELFDQPAEGAK